MPFKIVRNDIITMTTDIIVNPANNHLQRGGGVCGAIFKGAGVNQLILECNAIGYCETGDVVFTKSYELPCKGIIHTVGPIWRGNKHEDTQILEGCYEKALRLTTSKGYKSIAFPLISSGAFGFPKDLAMDIATKTIESYLKDHDLLVYLVVYDTESYHVSKKLQEDIERFIDDVYVDEHMYQRHRYDDSKSFNEPLIQESLARSSIQESLAEPGIIDSLADSDVVESPLKENRRKEKKSIEKLTKIKQAKKRSLDDLILNMEESFSQQLFRYIDEKDFSDVEVYKKANLDRRVFSKIRSKSDYRPKKNTAIALAIALELNYDETQDLLNKAGYALSRCYKLDVIIEYFIRENNYNIYEINEVLFAFGETVLG